MSALLALAAVVAGAFAVRTLISDWRLASSRNPGVEGDIAVYIGAINHLNSGGALYRWPPQGGFGFTYPPVAALALQPLTWAAHRVTGLAWLALSLVVAVALVALVVRRLAPPTCSTSGRIALFLLGVGLFAGSGQVQSDLITGQVNLFLALMLILDIGGFTRRGRGILTGLAASIKLTPLIAIGWFAITRQWRAAAVSSVTFVGATAVGWIMLPRDSVDYWTWAVFDTKRVGQLDLPMNASVMGTLAKLGLEGPERTVLWLGLGGMLVLLAYWRAEQSRRMDEGVAAAILLGCASVIASPISWPHHQIWLPLAALVLICRARHPSTALGVALALFCFLRIPLSRVADGSGWLEGPMDGLDFVLFAALCALGLGANRAVGARSGTSLAPQCERLGP